jgi:hypothetical protein
MYRTSGRLKYGSIIGVGGVRRFFIGFLQPGEVKYLRRLDAPNSGAIQRYGRIFDDCCGSGNEPDGVGGFDDRDSALVLRGFVEATVDGLGWNQGTYSIVNAYQSFARQGVQSVSYRFESGVASVYYPVGNVELVLSAQAIPKGYFFGREHHQYLYLFIPPGECADGVHEYGETS